MGVVGSSRVGIGWAREARGGGSVVVRVDVGVVVVVMGRMEEDHRVSRRERLRRRIGVAAAIVVARLVGIVREDSGVAILVFWRMLDDGYLDNEVIGELDVLSRT